MGPVGSIALFLLALRCQSFRVRKSRNQGVQQGAQKYVVTLGDSYSSGTGIHTEGKKYDEEFGGKAAIGDETFLFKKGDLECWRETNSTPGPKLAKEFGMGQIMMACKGAVIADIERQFDYLVAKYPEETKAKWKGSVIILTAGGNNLQSDTGLRWPDIITKCTIGWAYCHEVEEYQPTNFDDVKAEVKNLLQKIATHAPLATIRLVAYPPVMKANQGGWRRCPGLVSIHGDEADWIDGLIIRFNQALKLSVTGAKKSFGGVDMKFVPVSTFFGKGACGTKSKHINAVITSGLSVSDASFHPTQAGFNSFYKALSASSTADMPQ